MERTFRSMVEELAGGFTPEMEDWFLERTAKHIKLVRKYCKKIFDFDPVKFAEIIDRGWVHDRSKFDEPEYTPYVHLNWKHKNKNNGQEYKMDPEMEERVHKATEHHILANAHHPEKSAGKASLSRENRDKSTELVDGTGMSDLDIGEMCADWCAMGEELGNSPIDWADKQVNKRWKFSPSQVKLIYTILEEIWDA